MRKDIRVSLSVPAETNQAIYSGRSDLSRVSLATFLAVNGWPVFPCEFEGDNSKRGLATTDPNKVTDWWYEDCNCMFGVLGRLDNRGDHRTPVGIRALGLDETRVRSCDGVFLVPPTDGWKELPGSSAVDTGNLHGKYTGYEGEW